MIKRISDAVVAFFEAIEHTFVSVAIIIAPWLADLVVAGLAARNVQQILGWPQWLAIAVGAGLEGLGMSSAGVALELRRYNSTRGAEDPAAPATLAWFMVLLQFVGSVVLALLNTVSGLQIYAIVAIPVLGGGGTLTQMLHDDHKKRLADQQRRIAKAERKAARLERSKIVPERSETSFQMTPEREALVSYYAEHQGAAFRTVAKDLERPLASVHRDVGALLEAGHLRKNGHGIEVAA